MWVLYDNWELVSTYWGGVWEDISNETSGWIGVIKTSLNTFMEGWKNIFTFGMKFIRGEIAFDPKGIITSMWSGVKNIFSTAVDGWKLLIGAGWDWIKSKVSWSPLETIKSAWSGVVAWFEQMFGKISSYVDKITGFATTVKGFVFGEDQDKKIIQQGSLVPPEDISTSTPQVNLSNMPTTPVVNSQQQKTVHITEGDIYVTVHGRDDNEIVNKAVTAIKSEMQSKKDRSVYE